jgi:hypothetical protein
MWQNGVARVVNFGFDGEVPKSLTMTADCGGPTAIRCNAANGTTAASRQLDIDTLVVLMPNNVTLPSVG